MNKIAAIFVLLMSMWMVYADDVKLKIAVLDFSFNETKLDINTANDITELFVAALINTGKYDVIERSKLKVLLNELKLQNSDDFSDEFRQQLGNLLGINAALLGNITKFDSVYSLNVRCIDVSTGLALFADAITIKSESELPEMIARFVYQLGIASGENGNGRSNMEQEVTSKNDKAKNMYTMKYQSYRKSGFATLIPSIVLSSLGTTFLITGSIFFPYGSYLYDQGYEYKTETITNNDVYSKGQNFMTAGAITLMAGGVISGLGFIGCMVSVGLLSYSNFNKELLKTAFYVSFADARGDGVNLGMKLSF